MYGYGIATLMSPPTIVLSLLPLFYPFYHRLSLPSLFCHLPSSICPCHHRLIPQIIESSPPIIFSIPQIMVLSLLSSIHPLPTSVCPTHHRFILFHHRSIPFYSSCHRFIVLSPSIIFLSPSIIDLSPNHRFIPPIIVLSLPSSFYLLQSSFYALNIVSSPKPTFYPQIIISSPSIIAESLSSPFNPSRHFCIPPIIVLYLPSSFYPLPFVSLNLIIVFPSHNLFISHHCFNPFSHRLISHFIPPIIVLSSFIVVLSLRRFISLISRNSPSLVPCRRYTYSKPSSPYIPCPAPRPHHCLGLRSPCPAMSRSSPQLESASLDARPSRARARASPPTHTHTPQPVPALARHLPTSSPSRFSPHRTHASASAAAAAGHRSPGSVGLRRARPKSVELWHRGGLLV